MMRFRSRTQAEEPAQPNTVIGVSSSFRGTLMVTGILRIDGEFEGVKRRGASGIERVTPAAKI